MRAPCISTENSEDDLAAWLEDMHMEDGQLEPEHCLHPKINSNQVALYRCSWCGNPSAVLRKCSGCTKTRSEYLSASERFISCLDLVRYCDAACQKAHWGDHKSQCKSV